ncbi:hypothetical protein [Bdellovibrio sp. HCB337]|uniref:hypothetical protein n=1 Tax=Bdellovibrio sp. HCB337 TaxID=3394358 RepID=UPI0039A6F02A
MAQKNMDRDMKKPTSEQQVRGSDLREKMGESLEKGEEFRREHQGADQMKTEVNRSSADTRKDTETKRKAP